MPRHDRLFALGALPLSLLSHTEVHAQVLPAPKSCQVTASPLNVRAGPSTSNRILGTISRGQVYPVLERRGVWARLQVGSGQAWSSLTYLRPSSARVYYVLATYLNVRSGPGTRYRTRGALARGTPVSVVETRPGWAKAFFNGGAGWLHTDWIGARQPKAQKPTPQAQAPTAPTPPPPSSPRRTSRAGFIQLAASGPGFESYTSASRRWGKPAMIYGFERAGRRWKREERARMGIGDISLENGGYFAPHSSHRDGRDVDMAPVRKDDRELPVTVNQSAYSRTKTSRLIQILRQEMPVDRVLFNDSGVPGVQYYPGHDNHFHLSVR
jgi:uncharacterized protein YraI